MASCPLAANSPCHAERTSGALPPCLARAATPVALGARPQATHVAADAHRPLAG